MQDLPPAMMHENCAQGKVQVGLPHRDLLCDQATFTASVAIHVRADHAELMRPIQSPLPWMGAV
jgi:hypothetical protein